MAEQETVVRSPIKGKTMGMRLANVIKFVEEESMAKRVVVSFDAEWANNLSRHLQDKYPELGKFSVAQVKGALKLLLKDITVETVAKEGFTA